MFNVGGPEIVVILIIALLVLGPDQLPKAMRTFGNAQAQIKQVTGSFKVEIDKAMNAVQDQVKDATDPEPKPSSSSAPASTATSSGGGPTGSDRAAG